MLLWSRIPRGSATAPPADASVAAPASAAVAASLALPPAGAAILPNGPVAETATAAGNAAADGTVAGPTDAAGTVSPSSSSPPYALTMVQPDGPDGLPDPCQLAVVPHNVLADSQAARHKAQQDKALAMTQVDGALTDIGSVNGGDEEAAAHEGPVTDLSVEVSRITPTSASNRVSGTVVSRILRIAVQPGTQEALSGEIRSQVQHVDSLTS